MAKTSVTKRPVQYQLPEKTRLSLIRESSDKPGAAIPQDRLAVVHRERRRFIKLHGHDGFEDNAV